MKIPLQVLVVQENDEDLAKLMAEFEAGGYQPQFIRTQTEAEFGLALKDRSWDIIIGDDNQSDFDAISALGFLRKTAFDLPFIVVSCQGGEENAVAAMRAGAHDYILKSNLCRLVPAVEREMREAEMRHERKAADATIHRLSQNDYLTGLPNRIDFYDKLQQGIDQAQRHGQSLALLVMDLDRFKDINDSIGYYYGDVLLQQVAARIRQACGDHAHVVARMGGDEFAILCPQCDAANIGDFAQNLLRIFAEPFQLSDHRVNIGASMGIAIYPQHGIYADTLLQHADVAMYRAKYANSEYAVYDEQRDPQLCERLGLVDELEKAIDGHQLVLQYQPIVDIQSRRVSGMEALVRWQHPKHGLLAPADFVPSAEHTDVIRRLSHWVLDNALQQLAQWNRAGLTFTLAVNLPVRSLHDLRLHEAVSTMLGTYGVTANKLVMEITERTLMVDMLATSKKLERLSSMGVRFTLDDFGTGQFSLGYLKKLPIDTLKIDQSFVAEMAQNAESESIIRAAVELGHCLGMEVLAEGVQNRDTWDLLVVHGCDKVQGNFIAAPMAAAEVNHWIKHSPWSIGARAKAS